MGWCYPLLTMATIGGCLILRTSGECVASCTQDDSTANLEPVLTKLDALTDLVQAALVVCTKGGLPVTQFLRDRMPVSDQPINQANTQDPKDCKEAFERGSTTSGVYRISPDGTTKINVYCEQQLDGGGWTVFQHRKDGSEDFNRDWAQYKRGFGDLTGEFWLGNDNIHLLTKDHDQKLKVELRYHKEIAYADYSEFCVTNEDLKYKLYISGFSGSNPPAAGDSFTWHNQSNFSTKDSDNDSDAAKHCARDRTSAWWFKNCEVANLNGVYGSTVRDKGVNWDEWKGPSVSLTGTRMMVKRRS